MARLCGRLAETAELWAKALAPIAESLMLEMWKATRGKVPKAACSNYQNSVTLPLVGSHVRIVGVYVQDTFHAQWMEIHPVTSIVVG